MRQIESYLNEMDETTLVVFDVDLVLLVPSNPFFQPGNYLSLGKRIKEITATLSKEERDLFVTLIVTDSPSTLLDAEAPALIERIFSQGAKAIALTAVLTGAIDGTPSLEQWRYQVLKELGIDFSAAFPDCPALTFEEFPAYRGYQPVFSQGILYTNGEQMPNMKGQVLRRFLEGLDWLPSRIVFIDDRRENLDSVTTTIQEWNPSIELTTLHYTAAENYATAATDPDLLIERWRELASKAQSLL